MSPKREAAIWATIGISVLSLLVFGIHSQGEEEANLSCYRDIPAYYTWDELRPLVDETLADEFITIRECDKLLEEYGVAQTNQERRAYFQEYKAMKK